MLVRFILYISLLIPLLCATTATQAAQSSDAAASVVALRGMATATDSKGQNRTLALNSPLFTHDTIKTGQNGRLRILFKDNSIITIGSKSVIQIAQYNWDEKIDTARMVTVISEGVFRVVGGLVTKKAPQKFKTLTPAATIGIRGSMFAGKVSADGLTVVFEGGKGIELTNSTGSVAITSMGQACTAPDWSTVISPPLAMDANELDGLRKSLSVKPAQPGEKAGVSQTVHEILSEEFTSWVKNNPQQAGAVLQAAVASNQLAVDSALGAVLLGMQNVDRPLFDAVLDRAISMGLTPEQTKKVIDRFKKSGGVCP